MIKTSIITGFDEGFPIWHPYDGFAKNELIAQWLFEHCGWAKKEGKPAELCILEQIVDWAEGEDLHPNDHIEFYVLGARLLKN